MSRLYWVRETVWRFDQVGSIGTASRDGKNAVARLPFIYVKSGSWSHIHPVLAKLASPEMIRPVVKNSYSF